MITFTRDGTCVLCSVTLDVPLYETRDFFFKWECNREHFAGLLADAMSKAFSRAVSSTRKEEYMAGWKDAKSHATRKRDYFTFRLTK